ncbi:DUF423 domain-containing protein [Lysinibacillus sp. 54212]|uniref:DUF423 domain-containing protein n=1 Tax=Lysinibacillus sp. 54212 TaxID=3119829 RepID=UPI002FC8F8D7
MVVAIILGAVLAFLSVAFGAFGAHALKDKFKEVRYAENWETACRYQMYHGLGLISIGILTEVLGASGALTSATYLMFAGTLIFSGSLYILSLTGIRKLGAITPIGGLLMLVAWILVIIAAL